MFRISNCHFVSESIGNADFSACLFILFPLCDASLSILRYLDHLKYENATYHT